MSTSPDKHGNACTLTPNIPDALCALSDTLLKCWEKGVNKPELVTPVSGKSSYTRTQQPPLGTRVFANDAD